MVGRPSGRYYKGVVSNKLLPNFPFTIHDITNDIFIFGPYISGVGVNKVVNNPIRLDTEEYLTIPEDLY